MNGMLNSTVGKDCNFMYQNGHDFTF